ncbi:universal stress protein [Rhodocaloribacter litoris]|uniref:universal stress protein n=1 Tax=Rhodocaloribacter litoris TaxID=2558931 RepID=UPI00142321F3|nr:universal stress protein [Rhodocaloribacter litoris]QXD16681.1 universal stress protein [Rhodocaloribacter litoris]
MPLYRHLGVAVTFSPRLEALLAETAYRAPGLAARLSLVHAGDHTPEHEAHLRRAMEQAGLPRETEILWVRGAPDAALLEAVETYGLDLLLAGALEKEHPLRYYLGSVARNLVREAPCSLLLFTEPRVVPQPVRRLVVVTDYSELALIALTKAVRLAEQEQAERVYVLRVLPQFGEVVMFSEGNRRERARSSQKTSRVQEETLLRDLVDAAGHSRVPVEPCIIEGHTGYIAAQFARDHEVDLLVMPSASRHSHFFERLFPSDMEWVLREIPCNLWVVRASLP